jgi:2-dehydropantoate 2-reductase
MRYVIFGAGAIGGAIGGKLAATGHEVVLIARGAHLEALRARGLELRDPDSAQLIDIPAAASVAEVGLRPGDCVLVATKSQQSENAVADLVAAAGDRAAELPVVCAQNGVENERIALRRLGRVYGMRVILAGTHLEPGVVEIATAPVFGILDVGRYPSGEDALSQQWDSATGGNPGARAGTRAGRTRSRSSWRATSAQPASRHARHRT